jgi:hypothetical protein
MAAAINLLFVLIIDVPRNIDPIENWGFSSPLYDNASLKGKSTLPNKKRRNVLVHPAPSAASA